jgi:hypothetical protein
MPGEPLAKVIVSWYIGGQFRTLFWRLADPVSKSQWEPGWPDQFMKKATKMWPTHFSSIVAHNLYLWKVEHTDVGYFCDFQKNFPE